MTEWKKEYINNKNTYNIQDTTWNDLISSDLSLEVIHNKKYKRRYYFFAKWMVN